MTPKRRASASVVILSSMTFAMLVGRAGAGTDSHNFLSLITATAARDRIAIIAEAYPLRELSADAQDRLTPTGSPDTDVPAVAAAYDYDIAEHKGNVYFLKKRYSDPIDTPDITESECLRASAAIQGFIDAYAPKSDWSSILTHDFPVSLSPDQWKQMESKSLPLRSLTASQKDMLMTTALSGYISEEMGMSGEAVFWLKRPRDKAFLCRGDLDVPEDFRLAVAKHGGNIFESATKNLFGFKFFSEKTKGFYFTALSGIYAKDGFFESGFDIVSKDESDPTDPARFPELRQAATASGTLGSVLASLNSRGKIGESFRVDKSLAGKAVTSAGLQNAEPRVVLEGVASLYGLQIRRDKIPANQSSETLVPRDVAIPRSIAELGVACRDALPDPLVRALHLSESLAAHSKVEYNGSGVLASAPPALPDAPDGEETQAQLAAEMEKRHLVVHGAELVTKRAARRNELDSLPGRFRQATIARLRMLAEPSFEAAPGGELPFASLTAREANLFATIVLAELAMRMDGILAHPTPGSLLHFDDVLLGGGISANKAGAPRVAVSYFLQDPSGKLHVVAGFFDIPYEPNSQK